MSSLLFRLILFVIVLWFASSPVRADVVITMGGDVNFNKDKQKPESDGVVIGGTKYSFDSLTPGLRPLADGDLNFANVETVVTDRRDLDGETKLFTFQSHPNAFRHLMALGFNLFSLANNHAYDYGFAGFKETLSSFSRLKSEYPDIQFAGVGRDRREAAGPVIFQRNGFTIAYSAIAIMDPRFRAGETTPGMLNFQDDADYGLLLKAMHDATADLKILSIHFGTEKQVELDAGQRARFNRAVTEAGVDLVIGHHPHVVRPVEMVNGRLIIYSLGNYLMPGAADITGRAPGYDFGLFGRVYFGWDASERRLKAQAMEVVPLTQMHFRPRAMDPSKAASRVQFLNNLSRNSVGPRAVQFTSRTDGSGIACATDVAFTPRAAKACGATLSLH